MSIIAEYSTGTEGLVLEQTLERVDARVEVERAYATDPERPFLFVWVTCEDPEAFEAAMADDPTVGTVQRLNTVEERILYRIRVTDETETVLYPVWVRLGGEGLEAYSEGDKWHSRIRFPDRDALAEYESFVTGTGLPFELKRLYDATAVEKADGGTGTLTDEQRETLLLAYERGFFDIPRRATAADLAAELDVSRQAVSERLRRGYATLVERHVR